MPTVCRKHKGYVLVGKTHQSSVLHCNYAVQASPLCASNCALHAVVRSHTESAGKLTMCKDVVMFAAAWPQQGNAAPVRL